MHFTAIRRRYIYSWALAPSSLVNFNSAVHEITNLNGYCQRLRISLRCQSDATSGAKEKESRGPFRWLGIPLGLGITCLASLHLLRIIRRERKRETSVTWQLAAFRLLPARSLSRAWGNMAEYKLPVWARKPLLGLYVRFFGCNMTEAAVEDLSKYPSLLSLFCRPLKTDARPISQDHDLVSPCDGKILHFGKVEPDGTLEQIKGISYKLHKFLGPSDLFAVGGAPGEVCDTIGEVSTADSGSKQHSLYHVVVYLAPGDYHHFHSPAQFSVKLMRHFPGELLTVAPWAARTMPGLFTLNERIVLNGLWKHGYFGMVAVGALNVGSIKMALNKDIETNKKGRYMLGQYNDIKLLSEFKKGERVGNFSLGSTIVMVFEAPENFKFLIESEQSIKYGQPLGTVC